MAHVVMFSPGTTMEESYPTRRMRLLRDSLSLRMLSLNPRLGFADGIVVDDVVAVVVMVVTSRFVFLNIRSRSLRLFSHSEL